MRQVRVTNFWRVLQGISIGIVIAAAGHVATPSVVYSDPCRVSEWWFLFVDCWGW